MRKSRHSPCQTTGMWEARGEKRVLGARQEHGEAAPFSFARLGGHAPAVGVHDAAHDRQADRKSTRLNSSHLVISYAVFCLKKKKGRSGQVPTSKRPSSATVSAPVSAGVRT